MDKITYFKATSLRMAGFKHHDQPVEYQFGDITVISGGNRVGKTTIADAIAFAITGKGYMGDRFIDRFYHKDGRKIRLSLSYLDQTGMEHTIDRCRRDDKMEIALDGRSILQRDLFSMFGDLDEFLALYNPLYFIEVLQEGGRKLLEKHLPPMPQENILAQMSEIMRAALEGYTFISPETALANLRAEKKELEGALLAYSGRQEMAAEVAVRQADAKNLLSAEIADLQKRADQWEARRTEGLDMKALNLELIEMSDWYNELLKEKPKPFDPAPYRERQAKLREKIEARRQEIYESKLTEQFVKVEKPLQALLVKFNQTSGFLKSLEPGTVCPLCHRAVTAEEHIACEVALKSALEKYKVKGTELRLQQKELEVLEKKCHETFEKYKKDDLTALQRESAAVTAECDRENDRTLKEHEEYTLRMRETSQRIERLQEQIWAGNLSSDEMTQYEAVKKELGEKKAVLKNISESIQPEQEPSQDKTYEMMTQSLAQIEDRIAAVLDFAATRNKMLFEHLHTQNVACKLFDIVKSTGEIKETWKFTYEGRDYRCLSHSEKVLAGMEMVELLKKLLGRCYPVFADDTESIDNIPRPSGQSFLARVARGQPLKITIHNQQIELPRAG